MVTTLMKWATANDSPEQLIHITGSLLRKESVLPTAGEAPFQIDYDDYKETSSGLRFPFTMRMTPAANGTVNALDDSRSKSARQSPYRRSKICEAATQSRSIDKALAGNVSVCLPPLRVPSLQGRRSPPHARIGATRLCLTSVS